MSSFICFVLSKNYYSFIFTLVPGTQTTRHDSISMYCNSHIHLNKFNKGCENSCENKLLFIFTFQLKTNTISFFSLVNGAGIKPAHYTRTFWFHSCVASHAFVYFISVETSSVTKTGFIKVAFSDGSSISANHKPACFPKNSSTSHA